MSSASIRKIAKFGEFLTSNKRPFTLAEDQDADLVGMRLYGAGPFHREHKAASAIRKKTHFVARSGDIIYNKLFAWKGTFGIVPDALDGMYVSDKFPTYELDRNKVDEAYLGWFFKYPGLWDQARQMSTGSAALSKFTLNPPRFLDLEIPLPPKEAQERIASRLSAANERVAKMRSARSSSTAAAKALTQAFVNDAVSKVGELGVLSDVLQGKPRNGWSVRCDNAEGGVPVLTLGAVTGFNYNAKSVKRTSEVTLPGAHYWLEPGDLLITRSNTAELVGNAAIYSGEPHPCIYPDLIMKIPLDHSKADIEFVWHWLQSPVVRDFIMRQAKGTSPTMKKISQGAVMTIPFPSRLSLDQQRELHVRMDVILNDRRQLDRLQTDSNRLVEQIVPALLKEAFGG